MAILNYLLLFLILIVCPIVMGAMVTGYFRIKPSLIKCSIIGYVMTFAICQIVAVPCILAKQSFTLVVVLLSIIFSGIIVVALTSGRVKAMFGEIGEGVKTIVTGKDKLLNIIAVTVTFMAILFLVLVCLFLQHTDADDSRFVVNAVDIWRTNRLLLTDVNSGNEISTFLGDLNKDVVSPWPVYIAYIARLTGTNPTVIMHYYLAAVLTVLVCFVYILLSEEFFKDDVLHRCIFVCFVILLNIYGFFSVYKAQTFYFFRLWQGKAVVAAMMIPFLWWVLIRVFRDDNIRNIILLLMTSFSMCLLSNMGAIIGGFIVGVSAISFGVMKKSFKLMIIMMLTVIPNALYIGIGYLM